MKRWGMSLILAWACAAAACRKEEPSIPEVKPAATEVPPVAKEPPKPALPWPAGNEASYAALQGAWVVQGFGSYDNVQAWNVVGHKVTVYEAKDGTEAPDELIFESPCAVRLKEAGWGGTFVKRGDTVHLGLGSGGWKDGDTTVVCMYPGVIWATKDGCKAYKQTFGEWEVIDAKCTVADGAFKVETADHGSDIRFVDDTTMMTDQLKANAPARMADWAAAKAKADELVAK